MTFLCYPKIGDRVKVVQKKDYGTQELTEGVVKEILTKIKNHPRGTKVRLESGIVGRIQEFVGEKKDEVSKKQKSENSDKTYFKDPDALI